MGRKHKEMDVDLKEMSKEERLERLRHSAAHIMAEAVVEMFPDAKIGIGPPIDTGFYYDFELPRTLTTEDLPEIEEKMAARIKSDVPFVSQAISKADANERFKDQPYKLELIEGIEDAEVGLYEHGNFVDLCQGPHVERTGEIPNFTGVSDPYEAPESAELVIKTAECTPEEAAGEIIALLKEMGKLG